MKQKTIAGILFLLVLSLGIIAYQTIRGTIPLILLSCIVLAGLVLAFNLFNTLRLVNKLIDRTLPSYKSRNLLSKVNELLEIIDSSDQNRFSEELIQKQTRIEALQSQINPHFLYNTLDSIRGQALMDGAPVVADMAEALATMFRYTISQTGNFVRLQDELRNAEHYLMLQQFRFENQFIVKKEIESSDLLNCIVPRMSLQPIIENAIFHGLETISSGGVLKIKIYSSDSRLIIRISDNGRGMSADDLGRLNEKLKSSPSRRLILEETRNERSSGIALANVNQRIRLSYGDEYGICAYSTPLLGTDIEFILPAIYKFDAMTARERGK